MNPQAMAARLSVLARALPMRILLVDDDERELESLAERLRGAGFEVTCATAGEQALSAYQQRWYPLVVTDWNMPVMDGMALTRTLRTRAGADTYVILLTTQEDAQDYEQGYLAGVDDYLIKHTADAELFARIHSAFNTLALRRTLKEAQALIQTSSHVDEASGAISHQELHRRLHSEIRRALRYRRELSVVLVSVTTSQNEMPASDTLRELVQALERMLRADVDWVGRIDGSDAASFAIVLPEAAADNLTLIRDRLSSALTPLASRLQLRMKSGAASLSANLAAGAPAAVDTLLRTAAAGV